MKSIATIATICLLIGIILTSCTKDRDPLPPCIQEKIDSIKVSPKTTPPAQVHAWNYGGTVVYLFTAPCCEEFVKVFDENCQYICSPSGGPLQYGDSLCTDFYQDAKYIGLIFRDDQ